jgi:DtxR family Mn-dependent transcriptional regulator
VERKGSSAATNDIAQQLSTSAASVSDMIRKLSDKKLVEYEKYKGSTLSEKGLKIATNLIRKHRLWEVFLVEKLNFTWDEIHEIAEELEHIRSPKLIERLDGFLNHPKFDPHGDPIPNAEGHFHQRKQIQLDEMQSGQQGIIVGVKEHSTSFLQFLENQGLILGTDVEFLEKFDFDESVKIKIKGQKEQTISKKVSQNLYVQVV